MDDNKQFDFSNLLESTKQVKEGQYDAVLAGDWAYDEGFVTWWMNMVNAESPEEREDRIGTSEKIDYEVAQNLLRQGSDDWIQYEVRRYQRQMKKGGPGAKKAVTGIKPRDTRSPERKAEDTERLKRRNAADVQQSDREYIKKRPEMK